MELSEFIEATSRIEEYYNKEYTNEQRQIMFEELKDFSIERYKKLISVALRKNKFLPKIADFIEADVETSYGNKHEEEIERVECKKCNSTGYIVYDKIKRDGNKELRYQYAAICTCGNAKQYKGWETEDKNHKSEFYTPLITELGLV